VILGLKIRAVTLFLDLTGKDTVAIRSYLEDKVRSFLEAIDEFRSRGIIWGRGVRLSVSHSYDGEGKVRLAKVVKEECESIGVNMISGFVYDAAVDDPRILEDLSSIGVYIPIKPGSPVYYGKLVESLSKISCRNPISLTRIATLFGEGGGLLTPYFPLSMNTRYGEGVALALLYARDLVDAYRVEGLTGMVESACRILSRAESIGRCIASTMGIDYYGLDYSLSPWMDDSVALLIEEISGSTLPNPGSLHTVSRINNLIHEAAIRCGILPTGFCEIMLPVAEDNILKERVRDGMLRLRDLIALSSFCVAGVDMVVIPAEIPDRILLGVMLDLSEVSRLKGKPIGLRIIPYPGVKPGDRIDLGVFGEIPVIEV
jgi:uncharacterized protein (UPF0210 family)